MLLDEAAWRGWDAVGIEPSAWAARAARRRGVKILECRLEDADLQPDSIDAVVAADVLEHVTDPVAFSRRLHRSMTPGAVLLVCTPDVGSLVARVLRRWWWSVLPGHLVYFSRSTLMRLLLETGFEVVDVRTHPKTQSVGYYAGRLAGYTRALGALARLTGRTVVGTDRLVTPDFRDRVAAVAIRAT